MTHQLRISTISHCYGRKKILEDISFECRTGDITGLFGQNGRGKSTLLNILFGTLKPASGSIRINDTLLRNNITQKQIGYSHQEIFLPQHITVRNVIPLYFPNGEDQNKIFYSPGIHRMETTKVGNLSLGEQRYLQFLLVIHLHHLFVLLDEPFSMVDPLYKEIIKEKIKEQSASKGFIITDHYYKDVLDIATKKLVIASGKIIPVNDEYDLAATGYLSGRQYGNNR
ncbi:ATP-binding cassette domain-containing protein [Agriterribacter sp.]|uniref:ATP-binding cassette domain-containing protein n=1 Tax=Agriterribacter sp. TaxID=2821509 RepID=UPI002C6E8484|nr:ATP-binding cassette domain-containing protein [Agriterribacter sp.]HRO47481.1 ATP-binding cassette domain-containing protein [Agriterribacter sp.]HRQ18604.1 ATP-binding cassette domain-containing protein [Agriterribacter sp.]